MQSKLNEDNRFVRAHLTNLPLQQSDPDFGARCPHNVLYFDALQRYLDAHTDFPMGSVETIIVPRIRRVVADVMYGALPAMVSSFCVLGLPGLRRESHPLAVRCTDGG